MSNTAVDPLAIIYKRRDEREALDIQKGADAYAERPMFWKPAKSKRLKQVVISMPVPPIMERPVAAPVPVAEIKRTAVVSMPVLPTPEPEMFLELPVEPVIEPVTPELWSASLPVEHLMDRDATMLASEADIAHATFHMEKENRTMDRRKRSQVVYFQW